MDADGRIIPIVEGDQGEGFKDEMPPEDINPFTKAINEMTDESIAAYKDTPKKQGVIENIKEPPPVRRMKIQMGMGITFHGYQYKVVKIMNRGRVMLKLVGEVS